MWQSYWRNDLSIFASVTLTFDLSTSKTHWGDRAAVGEYFSVYLKQIGVSYVATRPNQKHAT